MAFSASVRDSAVAEMNITPLVDVMLVLLVIFMVSAPLASRPLDASLPQNALPSPIKPMLLQVTVADDGSYRLNDRPLTADELWRRLDDAATADPRTVLQLSASPDANYQPLVTVLAEARDRGISNIGVQP